MANTFIDGKSLKQLRIDKTNNTKKLISDNGLDGYENAFLNGAGKNIKILAVGKDKKINTLVIKDIKGTIVNKDNHI
jgi:hypothetical protein